MKRLARNPSTPGSLVQRGSAPPAAPPHPATPSWSTAVHRTPLNVQVGRWGHSPPQADSKATPMALATFFILLPTLKPGLQSTPARPAPLVPKVLLDSAFTPGTHWVTGNRGLAWPRGFLPCPRLAFSLRPSLMLCHQWTASGQEHSLAPTRPLSYSGTFCPPSPQFRQVSPKRWQCKSPLFPSRLLPF